MDCCMHAMGDWASGKMCLQQNISRSHGNGRLKSGWVSACGRRAVNNHEKEVYNGDPGYISAINPAPRGGSLCNFPAPPRASPCSLLRPAGHAYARCLAVTQVLGRILDCC